MMKNLTLPKGDIGLLLRLSVPLILSGMMEASVGFSSTIFLSRLGESDLAAGAMVSWLFATLMLVLWGPFTGVSTLVAQKHGARDTKAISLILRDGLVLSVLLLVPTSLLLWYMSPIFILLGQNPHVADLADGYLHALAFGVLADFSGLALMQFLIGLGHTRTNLVYTLAWVPLNIFFNDAFIFGKFGFPKLGLAGLGWGTTTAYWITSLGLLGYILWSPHYRPYLKHCFSFSQPIFLGEIWRVGFPIGIMYTFEVGFFFTLTLLMGHIGKAALAANQVALQYLGQLSSITFAISQAVTIRMGHMLGANNKKLAKRACLAGTWLAVGFMVFIAGWDWFAPNLLIGVDFDVHDPLNADLMRYAVPFLALSAVFQIFEAVRLILFGALRSLNDTNFTLYISLLSFWGIALPLGYGLSEYTHLGYWWAMPVGAAASAALLLKRLITKLKHFQGYDTLRPLSIE